MSHFRVKSLTLLLRASHLPRIASFMFDDERRRT